MPRTDAPPESTDVLSADPPADQDGVTPEGGDYANDDMSDVVRPFDDAAALGFLSYATSDVNALQDMLEASSDQERKALRKYLSWVKAQGAKGIELQEAYTAHRQRTLRLYGLLTDNVNGIPAARQ